MNKRVIITGFHFPPSAVSSGHLRLLAFAKYLPEFGWEPVVLSATRGAYPQVDPNSVQSIPETCPVHRAFALDSKRHLGLFGKYPAVFAQPDRWVSWWPSAVFLGLQLIRRYRAQAIWSTYPIMTNHCVAYALNRLTGIPWIADFRDPVVDSVVGMDPMTVKSQTRWERRVVSRAARSVFTTRGAMQGCAERYPDASRDGRFSVIMNGYDETAFASLAKAPLPSAGRPLVLLHSGLLYPDGRNPLPFLTAVANLKNAGIVSADRFQIVLRASGSEGRYAEDLQRLSLDAIVTLAPQIPYHEALQEQANADGLLLFQGSRYDRQIPAKAYEYLRIGRPIFALVGEGGETAALLRETGGAELVPLDDVSAIEKQLEAFIVAVRSGQFPKADERVVRGHSRSRGASLLAGLLDNVVAVDPRVRNVSNSVQQER